MESPAPGTRRPRPQRIWYGLFVTGVQDRSIHHFMGSSVGGLHAPMGAEDLGLSFHGMKGDLFKSKCLRVAVDPQRGQGGCSSGYLCLMCQGILWPLALRKEVVGECFPAWNGFSGARTVYMAWPSSLLPFCAQQTLASPLHSSWTSFGLQMFSLLHSSPKPSRTRVLSSWPWQLYI